MKIANKTNRYALCECGQGLFEVLDNRRLLDSLLQWQAVLPFDDETGLSDFEKLLAHSGRRAEVEQGRRERAALVDGERLRA